LLELAEAQIQLKRWPAARATINTLLATAWPARFPNTHRQAHAFRKRLPE
jgi:hypothetical protein